MKTKNEIYVVVDTPKKAKKLQKVLDMFGEKPNEQAKENGDVWRNTYFYFEQKGTYDTAIYEQGYHTKGKQKVSIKELRNILAVEHLKEGDVVVTRQGDEKVIGLVNKVCKSGLALFEVKKWVRVSDGFLWDNKGCFDDFIRYATEEERLLLEPKEEKKELEVGKWYKYPEYPKFLSIHTNNGNRYGFDINGLWFNSDDSLLGFSGYVEATTEEVKQALVKEAQNRYKVCDKVKSFDLGEFTLDGLNLMYSQQRNVLYATDGVEHIIFNNGKWAEVLPQNDNKTDITDQDISTLERLHDTLHDVHGYSLEFELMKSARVLAEKLREFSTQTK